MVCNLFLDYFDLLMSQGEDAAASEASQETGSVLDEAHSERNLANQLRYSKTKL